MSYYNLLSLSVFWLRYFEIQEGVILTSMSLPIYTWKTIEVISVFWLEPIMNPLVWETVAMLVKTYLEPYHMGNTRI